jgi:hypothetical protein
MFDSLTCILMADEKEQSERNVRELDPSVDEHPDHPFQFITGPCSSEVFVRHRQLVQRLEQVEMQPLEPLWADVTALQLVEQQRERIRATDEHRSHGSELMA